MAHLVLRSPGARTVIRWQQCVLSIAFCNTAVAAVLASATFYEFQRHNREDEGDEGSPRAKLAEKARQRRVLEHSKQLGADRPPRTRELDSKKQFSTDFRLPYSHGSKASINSTKTKTTITNSIRPTIRKVSRHIPSNK